MGRTPWRADGVTGRLVRSTWGAWGAQGAPRVVILLAVLVVGLARPEGGMHPSRLQVVVGGPSVTVVAGQLQLGPPWTWLVLGLLFVVMSLPLVALDPAVVSLALVRGVSRRQWAVARLVALAAMASGFVALVVAVAALTVGLGVWSGPALTRGSVADAGVWMLVLTGLGWWQLGMAIVFDSPWPGFTGAVVLLGMSVFGPGLPPWLPTAQSILALHGLPGTLSWAEGVWYVVGWTILGGVGGWSAAVARLGYR